MEEIGPWWWNSAKTSNTKFIETFNLQPGFVFLCFVSITLMFSGFFFRIFSVSYDIFTGIYQSGFYHVEQEYGGHNTGKVTLKNMGNSTSANPKQKIIQFEYILYQAYAELVLFLPEPSAPMHDQIIRRALTNMCKLLSSYHISEATTHGRARLLWLDIWNGQVLYFHGKMNVKTCMHCETL